MTIDKLEFGKELRENSVANTKKINEVIDVVNTEASESEVQEIKRQVYELEVATGQNKAGIATNKALIDGINLDLTTMNTKLTETTELAETNKSDIATIATLAPRVSALEKDIFELDTRLSGTLTKHEQTIQTILAQITPQTSTLELANVYQGFVNRIAGLCIITIHFTGTLAKDSTVTLPEWANNAEVARSMVFNTVTGARICELTGTTITVLNGDIVANNGYTSDLQFVYRATD